jgi:hypothetical protein
MRHIRKTIGRDCLKNMNDHVKIMNVPEEEVIDHKKVWHIQKQIGTD